MKRLLLASLLLASTAMHADVRGTAVRADGFAVPGVKVELYAATTAGDEMRQAVAGLFDDPLAKADTDSRGNFKLTMAKRGNYVVRLRAEGFAPVVVETTGDEDLGGLLMRAAPSKSGRVTAGGKPVAGAIVILARGARHIATTDAEGRFTAPDPAVWSPSLTVVHPDYATYTLDLGAWNASPVPLDVKLTAGSTLRGRVLGLDGKSGAKAELFIDGLRVGESAEDGTYEIRRVPAVWKEIVAKGAAGVARAARSKSPSLRLQRAVTLRGNVVDPKSGAALENAIVWVETTQYDPSGPSTKTNARGAFQVDGLLPGSFRVVATYAGYATESSSLAITATTPPKTLYLAATARVSGTVVDDERKPVGGARVRVTPRSRNIFINGPAAPQVSAPDGRFATRVNSWTQDTGDLDLVASRSGYADSVNGPLRLGSGEEKTMQVTLSRGVVLAGRVTDLENRPLPGVAVGTVVAEGPYALNARFSGSWTDLPVTDAEGKFSLRVRPGGYSMFFYLPGFAPQKKGGVVASAESEPIDIKLEPAVSVSGRVTFADGQPAADFQVGAFADGPPTITVTDASGAFVLQGLPQRAIEISASSPDERFTASRQVKPPAQDVLIQLQPTVRVAGRVRAKGAGSVSDFRVDVTPPQQGDMWWGSPVNPQQFHDGDGKFVLDAVPVAPSELIVGAPGYVTTRVPLKLEAGKDVDDVEVTLDPAATVRGRVTSEGGAPVERAWISPQEKGNQRSTEATRSDANGEYVLDAVPPGETVLVFTKRGLQNAKKAVTLEPGETRVDVQMATGRTLSGRVVNTQGSAVPEAEVHAMTAGTAGGYASATADASGNFRLEGLAPGIFQVRAMRRGYLDTILEDVDIEKRVDITITLKSGAIITGRVSGLEPARFRDVFVLASGSGKQGQTSVNPDGTFRMEGAPLGKIGVRAVARGGSSRTSELVEIETEDGGTYKADIEFREHNTLRGRVTRNGVPVRSGNISFSSKGTRAGGSASVDAEGRYEVTGVRSGENDVIVRDWENNGMNWVTTRSITQSQTLDIDMNPATIQGRVVNDTNDEPIDGADVVLELPQSEFAWLRPQGRSAGDGRVLVENIPPGTYDLRVTREGFATYLTKQSVTDGASINLQVRLTPSAGLALRALDARNGQSVSAHVVARTQAGAIAFNGQPQSRPDGSMLVPLAPGSYRLTVNSRGLGVAYVNVTSPGRQDVTLRPGGILEIESSGGVTPARVMQADGTEYNTQEWASSSATFRAMDGTRVTDMAAGNYTLQVLDDSGNVTKSVPFEIHEGQVTKVGI